jgi:transposase
MAQIASDTGRSSTSIARDLDRWGERGMEGLADGSAPGNPPRISQKMRAYMQGRLSEQRTWNATQLAEALQEEFSVSVTPEAVRQHLLAMGYRWKRTCYTPWREPDPGQDKEAREELERLKEGPPKGGSSQNTSTRAVSPCAFRPRVAGRGRAETISIASPRDGGPKDA